jgi:hypothetical protein
MNESLRDLVECDWDLTDALPPEIKAFRDEWPIIAVQVALGKDIPPALEVYPSWIEVYTNGRNDASLVVRCDWVDDVHVATPLIYVPEELVGFKAIVLKLDHRVRYAQILKSVLLDTVGMMVLPDVVIDSVSSDKILAEMIELVAQRQKLEQYLLLNN